MFKDLTRPTYTGIIFAMYEREEVPGTMLVWVVGSRVCIEDAGMGGGL